MAQMDVGVGAEIRIDFLPIVLVVAYLSTVTADRQQAAQLCDLSERVFELANTVIELLLQRNDAYADLNTGPELLLIERLGDEIVRPALEPRDHIFLLLASR